MRLTKRYIVKEIGDLMLSEPMRYERYYINDSLRIQRKGKLLEKEILIDNIVLEKIVIDEKEFDDLKLQSNKMIIRDSYLYLLDSRVSIKKYYGDYEELIRVEVKFANNGEMEHYKKESWMGKDITNTPLGFDAYLSKLNREEFLKYYNNLIK